MVSTTVLPSMLAFGPQTQFPSSEVLAGLRQVLVETPELARLVQGIADLPGFWKCLTDFDTTLNQVPGLQYLVALNTWIQDGGDFPYYQSRMPNLFALPVTVILQLAQYVRYLKQISTSEPFGDVLNSIESGGIQGFCVGFLSASAVASSSTTQELALHGLASVILAVVAGAYVDVDGSFASPPNETRCFALRWKPSDFGMEDIKKLLQHHSGAYISSVNDDACVTITAPVQSVSAIIAEFHARDMRTKLVHVQGRFHSNAHSATVEKIIVFLTSLDDVGYPRLPSSSENEGLLGRRRHIPVVLRSTIHGLPITTESLSRVALESILSRPANWYSTVQNAVQQLSTSSHKTCLFAGFGDHIPASLLQVPGFRVQSLSSTGVASPQKPMGSTYPPNSIAIVGMAGRFPGADDLDELWQLLLSKASMVERAPERLNLASLDATYDYSGTKWWGNFLRNPASFDHRFFKKSSREALAWDPQMRVLLEVVYEALESSGYFGTASNQEISDYGCYIGVAISNWYDNLSCHPPTAFATTGTSRPFFSGTISHYFGWTGPALTIDTACSSSHVSIDAACKAIISGTCSRAIAGGTNIFTSPFDYKNLGAAGFLSPTGQCKPFDQGADGYCRGEGVGVVVLKSLQSAIDEGDNILGVIVGSATNQNQNCAHITVPHAGSQVKLYQSVMEQAGVTAEDISYVEAHGTGTGVGDPIEVQGLCEAFGSSSRKELLHFSSVKGNIGHTEATAGVAGLMKVLLMLHHKKIPPQASFSVVNSNIVPFGQQRMEIPRKVLPWETPYRVACVNSYGAAGSNAAVLVRQKPAASSSISTSSNTVLAPYPLFISAASSNSLSMFCEKLLAYIRDRQLQSSSSNWLPDLLFHLADRANHSLPFVLSTSISSVSDLESKLTTIKPDSIDLKVDVGRTAIPIILVFPGQENNFIGLSKTFYDSCLLFRHHVDQCNNILVSLHLDSLYPAIFQTTAIANLVTLHSALFSVQYASAKAWMDCGIQITAVVGHSFGQLTALCISGSLSLADALKLVTVRATIMLENWGSERGSMMWLQASRIQVDHVLDSVNSQNATDKIEVACYNGPTSHVVVGSTNAIERLGSFISNDSSLGATVRTKVLSVTHGFHSKFTDPLLPHLTELANGLVWNNPKIRLEACDAHERLTPPNFEMVAEHMRNPVFFQGAIQRLSRKYPQSIFLEAGHGSSFMKLVQGCVPENGNHIFLPSQLTKSNISTLAETTISLWKSNHRAQYWPFHRSQRSCYEDMILPPYQFEKTNLWLPFIGRTGPSLAAEVQEVPEHNLISFVGFKDENKQQAIFRIDPESERYQSLLKGHVMGGESLAPASLTFELVACASLSLISDSDSAKYVPCVENLHMSAPLGLDINKEIILTLNHLTGEHEWSFNITTKALGTSGTTAEEFKHTTGTVFIQKKTDSGAAQMFNRFQTLIGSKRCTQIMDDPNADIMRGGHIYRAFKHIVRYSEEFRGIKSIACIGHEVAGRVSMTVQPDAPPHQQLCDTPMTESMMGFAGFLVTYFNNSSFDDVYICSLIERIEIGGSFNPHATEWTVYATMTKGDDGKAFADVYVFEVESKRLVLVILGCHFSKISNSLLTRMLKGANKGVNAGHSADQTASRDEENLAVTQDSAKSASIPVPQKKSASVRAQVIEVIHSITDVPKDEIQDDSSLGDLGIDSLIATEVLNDLRAALGVNVDLAAFLFFEDVREITKYLDEKLGNVQDEEIPDLPATPPSGAPTSSENGPSVFTPANSEQSPTPLRESPQRTEAVHVPTLVSAAKSFESMRYNFDQMAVETKALNFWNDVYPDQARLVLAYILEAFVSLGCDLRLLQPGASVPQIRFLERHSKFVAQLYLILADGDLIIAADGGFTRTAKPIDDIPSETLLQQIIEKHPESANVHKLVQVIGSKLAACLTGEAEAVHLIFGTKENKRILEDMYQNWPITRTLTLLLGDFLMNAFSSSSGRGPFRILEIGAGTGGTTRHIVNHLQGHGIPFEYTVSDISASLVATAKRHFQGVDGMNFEVIDVEKEPPENRQSAYHVVIATNCIHATRSLDISLSNIRKMVRDDGVFILQEMTKNIFWVDIVYGMVDGWWLFEDGRTHAIVDETHWERCLIDAGFKEVAWTDGNSPESKTIRIIAAFPTASPKPSPSFEESKNAEPQISVETVVYKNIGNTEIHADIYYPSNPASPDKLPIALMIHGGSHMIFSRKDIRPPQTRLLLEKGFLPISLDHRMCPEINLSQGPMVDICDALAWARNELPQLELRRSDIKVDGEKVVVIGWSSGGQLAMSLGWTAPQRGLKPPSAILAFYCPSDYEDDWWKSPIQIDGAEDTGMDYDLFEGIRDEPITNYGAVGAWAPMSDSRIRTDPRCRLVLHINWKAQTIPLIINGLPSKTKILSDGGNPRDYYNLPQPSLEKIIPCSPLAQIRKGNYKTPTFFVHGTNDELIPWQHTKRTFEELRKIGVAVDLRLVKGAPHVCDLSSDPDSDGWKAVLKAYEFLCSFV